MVLELSRLQDLMLGPPDVSTPIGEVPPEVADYLGTRLRTVYLSRRTLVKIRRKHSYIKDFDFLRLPNLILLGLWMTEKSKPNHAIASCPVDESDYRYKIAIKRAVDSPEIWLTAFHKLNPNATRALLRRGEIILSYREAKRALQRGAPL